MEGRRLVPASQKFPKKWPLSSRLKVFDNRGTRNRGCEVGPEDAITIGASSSHQVAVRSNVLRCWKYGWLPNECEPNDGEYRSSSAILEARFERIQHVVGGC